MFAQLASHFVCPKCGNESSCIEEFALGQSLEPPNLECETCRVRQVYIRMKGDNRVVESLAFRCPSCELFSPIHPATSHSPGYMLSVSGKYGGHEIKIPETVTCVHCGRFFTVPKE